MTNVQDTAGVVLLINVLVQDTAGVVLLIILQDTAGAILLINVQDTAGEHRGECCRLLHSGEAKQMLFNRSIV